MGLFGQSTPFDAEVEKATSETNTNDNWSLILDVCDKVTTNPRSAKECLKSIMKRMGHSDPHVVMQAITLLDACANNCGKPFHLEIASRDFENEFRRLLTKAQPKVSMKMRQVLKGWVDGDFKNDPELNLIPSLYAKLRAEGYDFSNLNDKPAKTTSAKLAAAYKDPNVVSSQQEEEDIAKAIELSLKETKNSPKHTSSTTASSTTTASAYPSLYPTVTGSLGNLAASSAAPAGSTTQPQQPPPEARKVRALYDFEAAEENELTFFSGEIIHVVDDSDPNWWKGYNQRGEGLFPSNFVTADLSVDPERLDINQQHKTKQSQDAEQLAKTEAAAAALAASNQPVEIDEQKVDRLLHLLHEANPEDPSQDTPEMLHLEQEVHQMGPLIDAELERVDRKHAQLTQLSSDLVDAINLYHSLMASDRAALAGGSGFMPGMPGMPSMSGAMPGLGYQTPGNPQMIYGPAGYAGNANVAPGSMHFPTTQHSQQMPQNFPGAMCSLPYNPAAVTGMPTTTAGGGGMPGAFGQPVPMQYRNGNDNWSAANGYPSQQQQQLPQATNGVHMQNGQQHQAAASQQQQPQQPPPQQQQQPMYQSMPPVTDPQQQQQQFGNALPQQQPPQTQQFMSPQHQPTTQQQNPLQYMPPAGHNPQFPNGPHAFMPQQPQQQPTNAMPQTTAAPPPATTTIPALHQPHPSQLQQQFSAMSISMPQQQQQVGAMGVAGMPQSMAHIPIYQQQR